MVNSNELKDLLKENEIPNFVRIIGYDENTLKFLSDYYLLTIKKGKYINETILNPKDNEVSEFLSYVNNNVTFSEQEIKGFFAYLDNKNELAIAMINFLSTFNFDSESIKKNAYVKMMCWLRYRYMNVIRIKNPKILYEGNISKYELYFLKLLHEIGADVVLLNFIDDNSYQKSMIGVSNDKNILIDCKKKGQPLIHFTLNANQNKNQAAKSPIENKNSTIETKNKNFSVSNTFLEGKDVFEAVFVKDRGKNNIYAYINGAEADYPNKLFDFYTNITTAQKSVIIKNNKLANPLVDEVSRFKISGNIFDFRVDFLSKIELNILAKDAIISVVSKEPENKQKNFVVCFLCWLHRHKAILDGRQNVFILFSGYKYSDMLYLKVLKLLAIDVFLINPDKNTTLELKDNEFLEVTYENSLEMKEYPTAKKIKPISTVASNAESDLDTILYSGTGLFRDGQFTNANSIIIKTTYDEIDILWRVEAKYRSHFKAEDKNITIPTIFAKITGVDAPNSNKYIQNIKDKITKDTILLTTFNFCKLDLKSPILHKISTFYTRNELDIDKIRKSECYQYGYLNEDAELYILQKISEFMKLKYFNIDKSKFERIALTILLSLDKEAIRVIQRFDFTKEIPKMIILHSDESQPTLEDVIYITFFNLIGFDILIYTPTGYKNIEKHLTEEIYTVHKVGEYIFDINSTLLNKNQNFMSKLFGGGL